MTSSGADAVDIRPVAEIILENKQLRIEVRTLRAKAKKLDDLGAAAKMAEIFAAKGLDPQDIGRVTTGTWEMAFAKLVPCDVCNGIEPPPEEGKCQACAGIGRKRVAEKIDLTRIEVAPKWETGPEWPVVKEARPTHVKYVKRAPVTTDCRTSFILPDPQISFLRLSTGEIVSVHDERCMDVLLQVAANQPQLDAFINLGDFLDLAEWSSKFLIAPEFVLTTQPAVDRGHLYLAQQRSIIGPDGEILLFEGNHDDRIAQAIAKNAMAALRLRQANMPESWPVMSIPHLLRLDELGVEYVGGYPAGRRVIAERHGRQAPLVALHGERLDMQKQARNEHVSTVQGHAHHVAVHTEAYDTGDGQANAVQAWSLGCQCRVDGPVPSVRGARDPHGRPVIRQESWQQAGGLLTETADGWWLEPILVHDGVTRFGGKTYRSRVDLDGQAVEG